MGLKTRGQAIVDSTQRPLQGAFLIPPVLPVVLIRMIGGPTPNIREPSGALRYIGAESDVHLRSEARP